MVSECIIYILYYILAYIQHNGDVSLENPSQFGPLTNSSVYEGEMSLSYGDSKYPHKWESGKLLICYENTLSVHSSSNS